MKPALVAAVLGAMAVEAVRNGRGSGPDQSSCQAQDQGRRAFIQAKLSALGVECEEMCKRTGQFPNCQCPGFEGNPASDGDTRMCMTKYCQDPKTPCPTDSFVTCVKENTKISLLQWGELLQNVNASLGFAGGSASAAAPHGNSSKKGNGSAAAPPRNNSKGNGKKGGGALLETSSCQARDLGHRAFIQARLAVFGVECEEMCKRMNQFPNCQCPGFEGNPASDGDTRACMDRYCQDPKTPCPTDSFVTCVRETTKVSVLQWDSLLQRFGAYAKLRTQTMSTGRVHSEKAH